MHTALGRQLRGWHRVLLKGTSAWRADVSVAGRRQRGVPDVSVACRGHQTRLAGAPKITAKIILTQNEGRAGRSQAGGAPRGVCSAGGEGRGLLCPEELGRVGTQ